MSNPIAIVTKVVIIALIASLLYVINAQAEIRDFEENALDKSRIRIESLSEALKFYAAKKKRYTTDYDSVLMVVKSDTVLKQKSELVKLTNQYLDEVESIKSVPVMTDMITIRKALTEIVNILDEINDSYKSIPEIADKNLQLYENIKYFEQSPEFPNLVSSMNLADTLQLMSIEIGEYPLQVAVQKSIDFTSSISANLSDIERDAYIAKWKELEKSLYELEGLLKDPKQKEQVFTNRYLKHTEIVSRHMLSLSKLNLGENSSMLNSEVDKMTTLKDDFVNNYFVLSQRKGLKSLQKEEELLMALDENTIYAPPLDRPDKKKYKLAVTNNGFGYSVTCPNDEGEFARGIFSQRYKNYGSITNGDKSWEN